MNRLRLIPSDSFRVLLAKLKLELDQLTARIEEMDAGMQRTAKENEACQRLTTIPGIGPVTATALVAAIGNGTAFRKGGPGSVGIHVFSTRATFLRTTGQRTAGCGA